MARTKKVPVVKDKRKSGKSKDVMASSRKRKNHVFGEIRKYQSTTHNLIPKLPFSRLIRSVLQSVEDEKGLPIGELRITKEFLFCIHEASEIYLTVYFEDVNLLARHAGRVTIMAKDIVCLRSIKRVDHSSILPQ